jgi:hypothetical protein
VSSYEPHELKALGKAFDSAWQRIAPNIRKRKVATEVARILLADILFGLARRGNLDERWLADNAVSAALGRNGVGVTGTAYGSAPRDLYFLGPA